MSKFLLRIFSILMTGLILFGLFTPSSAAQELEEFEQQRQQKIEELQQERQDNREGLQEPRLKFYQQRNEKFQEFREKRREAFEEFRKKRARQWGEENVRMPDQTNYVSYDENGDQRHSVDFEEGKAKVEAVVDSDVSQGEVEQKLLEQIVDMVSDPGRNLLDDNVEVPEETPQPEDSRDEPLLAGQLKTEAGDSVTEENAEEFAKEVIEQKDVEKDTTDTKKGERVLVGIDLSLVPDHLQERVKDYQDKILNFARRQGLQPSVVFSIVHTESHFNPQARSSIPAYGLMQIVPETAGKDAYDYLYGEKPLLGADYLYQPENNLELGTAYLKKLKEVYLESIGNRKSRLYCAIASYNIGPGGMARTFVNSSSVQAASGTINKLEPHQVYRKLRENLPARETREYMRKVTENREHYRQWDK